MYRALVCLLFVSLSSISSFSQENVNDSILVESFLNKYVNNSIGDAMDFLYSSNPWMLDVDGAKKQLNSKVLELGILNGYVFIKKATLKERYSVFSYLLLYERQPLRFTFTLYKPDKKWRFQSFLYDTDIEQEMLNSTVVTWDF